ncbi:MAG TPA: aspartate carbamoyltransferase catalytic subunit [Acidobacteriota bacterium]|jgi:aspartate carbamoyltransferase catalytic subunit|nr:aspartate carbamoyltransferase catalytic subunit [Acidobacteriota bacterium]HRR26262.1 aspartate carbamoyltransferase catalytic subunit [Acidobacteriota bacterium]HRR56502.1 aspartate carbamoyltransferase catalytic subunit [Acidobacteriota bacterium]HRV08496.1 aspartate carbamoyltransferase catalytic subunit [Acidobacteriota bacterium]
MPLSGKHLLGIADLTVTDIRLILNTARSFREISSRPVKKVPTLRGRTIVNLFFEPSTRTRSSFEIAAKRLSADSLNFSVSVSSVTKGETLIDTGKNLLAMNPDILIVRHVAAGAPHLLARHLPGCSVINAGDGMHEHPTQALLDALTIEDHKKRFEDLKVAVVGDILHSRVARSNVLLLTKMGADVWVCGPPTLLPVAFDQYGVHVTWYMREALQDADVIMMLRTQRERQQEVFYPSVKEYFELYGLDKGKLQWAKPDVIVMHPGPINRGVEIDPDVADGVQSVILEQVTNGVAVRMAVLYLILGATEEGTR